MNNIRPLKILIISFDWRNIFENNFDELMQKMNRDRLMPGFNKIFIISWSTRTYYKEKKNIKTFHLNGFLGKFRIFYDFFLIFLAPLILKKKNFKPDFIVIRDFPLIFSAISIKIFFKSKITFFLGSLPTDLARKRKFGSLRWLYQYFSEFFAKHAIDYFIANGEATKKYFVKMGVNSGKIKIMTEDVIMRDKNFISTSLKGRVRKQYNIGDDKKILLSVGRLEEEKGFERLLDAFQAIKKNDLILIIAGQGVLMEKLAEKVKNLGLESKVIFSGFVSREDIWNYYQDADIFILLSRSEGLGLVFWEAMHMNIPVIGSKVGGIVDTIGENKERGFFWEKKDGLSKLNEIINKCIDNSFEVMQKKEKAFIYISEKINDNRIINDFI